MSAAAGDNRPIIIKKKKVIQGGGHHGGAWKVAYADFVTAMMAFFMLMWLLNASSEQQRAGLADYFAPTVTINKTSGGGDGMFGGDSTTSQDNLQKDGEGASMRHSGEEINSAETPDEAQAGGEEQAMVKALENLEEELMGRGGESIIAELALRHIVTRQTDEGLVIEFYDLPDASLFVEGTDEPMPVAYDIAKILADIIPIVDNPLAIQSHVRTQPIVVRDNSVWELSTSRATKMRELLEADGYNPQKIMRTTGEADRDPVADDRTDVRNNRIEIIVLRSDI
ncbi:chemotaxis protein MotB [Loktanella sp. F6476L]|uniref:flagellar motor protein MotB n=1 Tax=Loktanella sp. F6476L TaxID=2926405 RepID=UPI001FF687D0|nr:flagellar motor protein MotB [Loktanella sp. F6476L]MCK0120532.1 chemotaxis protein MotB [Loktanella sp. F6476L]